MAFAEGQPNPFAGIDWNTYQNWPTIQSNGYTYYEIPGSPQFVFDPYSGRYYNNPNYLDKAAKDAAGGSGGGAGAAIGGTLATAGGYYLANNPGVLGLGGSATTAANAATTGASAASTGAGAIGAAGGQAAGLQAPELVSASRVPTTAGAFDISGIGGSGNAILPIAGAVGAYDLFKNKRTGGRAIAQGAASGAAMGSYFGPPGTVIGAVVGGAAGALQHKSTKEYEKEKTDRLLKMSDAPDWQNTVLHLRGVEHAEGDKGENFNAQDAIAAAKQDGRVLWGTSAVLEQFGPAWFSQYSEPEREAITRALANADLFQNKKGDWKLGDKKRVQEVTEQAVKNLNTGGEMFNQPIQLVPEAKPLMNGLAPNDQAQMQQAISKFQGNQVPAPIQAAPQPAPTPNATNPGYQGGGNMNMPMPPAMATPPGTGQAMVKPIMNLTPEEMDRIRQMIAAREIIPYGQQG